VEAHGRFRNLRDTGSPRPSAPGSLLDGRQDTRPSRAFFQVRRPSRPVPKTDGLDAWVHCIYLQSGSGLPRPSISRHYWNYMVFISKKIILRPISPRSPCAPDVPGAYNVNSSSGRVRPGSFRPEVKGPPPMRPHATGSVWMHWTRPCCIQTP